MSMLNVIITPNYRLTTDATERAHATQFILQRRHIVDPTKAPGYKAEAGAAPHVTTEEWRNCGFYSLTASGISSAAKAAILRDTDVSGAETLAEALRLYADATEQLTATINEALALAVTESER